MSRAADRIQERLADRCAKLFAFAFQLRTKDKQHAAGDGRDGAGSGGSSVQPLRPDGGMGGGGGLPPSSMSGLPDLRESQPGVDVPMDAFTTVAIQPFMAEQLTEQAGNEYDQYGGGADAGAPPHAGVSDDAWAECEELQLRVDGLFRELEKASAGQRDRGGRSEMTLILGKGKKKGTSMNDVQLAKYALAAFIDELVLFSKLPIREAWASKPLQLEYFDDFNAGEAFYLKIEELRNSDDPRSAEVLEVYYACLVHGFRGKFNDRHGMEKRKVLIENLAREVGATYSRESGGSFAPRAMPPDELPPAEKRIAAWFIPLICLGSFLVLYILFSSLLGGQVAEVLDTLKNAQPES